MRKLLVVLASLAVPSAALACHEQTAQADNSPAPTAVAAKTKATKKPAVKKPAPPKPEGAQG